jgi:hypothetical protein
MLLIFCFNPSPVGREIPSALFKPLIIDRDLIFGFIYAYWQYSCRQVLIWFIEVSHALFFFAGKFSSWRVVSYGQPQKDQVKHVFCSIKKLIMGRKSRGTL